MSSEQMRSLLLRVIFDDEFHNLMLTDPQKAIESYKLTEDEKNVLSNPITSIYELLEPCIKGEDDLHNINQTPICTTSTVATTVVVYCSTTTSSSINALKALKNKINSETVKQKVDSVRVLSGAERFEKILELVSQFSE